MLLGESILPYRIFRPFEGVIPVTEQGAVLDAQAAATRGYSGLPAWMQVAERVWNENAESGNMTLVQRWNYHNELGSQFPVPPLRVLYAASGTIPAACLVRDNQAVVEHVLYWSRVLTESEGYYLCALFNAEATRKRIETHQARGQWGARHFDKVMFTLPIPLFDPKLPLHVELAAAAKKAEAMAAQVEIRDGVKFQRARKLIRDALAEAGISQRIDALVARLLDGG
ncbi:MAG: hypothetical protein ACT4SY_03935 [Hyphomicrobiales bacterium]